MRHDDHLDAVIDLGTHWLLPDGTLLRAIRGADGDDADDETGDAPVGRAGEVAAELADPDRGWSVDDLDAVDAELVEVIRQAPHTEDGVAEARAARDVLIEVRARRAEVQAEADRVAGELAEIMEEAGIVATDEAVDAANGPEDPDEEGDADGDGEGDAPAEEPASGDRVPVAASGTRRAATPRRPGRTPAAMTASSGLVLPSRGPGSPAAAAVAPRIQLLNPRASLVAGATATARPATSGVELLTALYDQHRNLGRTAPGVTAKVPVARFTWDLPENMRLSNSDPDASQRTMEAHIGQQALARPAIVAAGGICGPLAVDYTLPVIGSDARPVRDGLPSFQADGGGSTGRGGVRWRPSPTLANVDPDTFGVWTLDTDENPGGETKTCVRIECPSELQAEIEALYRCLEMGNFMARFSPEVGDAYTDLMRTYFARQAEIRALQKISAGSTPVTWPAAYGAMRDTLAMLEVTIVRYRRRHRILPTTNLVWMIPDWYLNLLRTDIAMSMPSGSVEENLTMAEAAIRNILTTRNVRVVEFMDGENDVQLMASAQVANAALMEWPNTIITYLFAEGTWVHMDGGQLDLGVVRDSTLNATNDFQVFSEEFWQIYKRGSYESFKISITTCPNGASAGTVAPVTCGAAS